MLVSALCRLEKKFEVSFYAGYGVGMRASRLLPGGLPESDGLPRSGDWSLHSSPRPPRRLRPGRSRRQQSWPRARYTRHPPPTCPQISSPAKVVSYRISLANANRISLERTDHDAAVGRCRRALIQGSKGIVKNCPKFSGDPVYPIADGTAHAGLYRNLGASMTSFVSRCA